MKYKFKKYIYLLLLLIFPSVTIELFSGSTPPLLFFNPITLLFFVICYGLPFILIREMKIRWNLGWSFIFLFPIIGIYIEGIFMQSFFNPAHADLGVLSNFGTYFGVQWPWTLYLTITHGIFSLVIPMFILDILFPSMKRTTFLSRRKAIISLILISLVTFIHYYTICTDESGMYKNYSIDIRTTLSCIVICLTLVSLAYYFKDTPTIICDYKNHFRDHFRGFFFMISVIFATYLFIDFPPYITILLQLLLGAYMLSFCIRYIYGTKRKTEDFIPLYNGTVSIFCFLAYLQAFGLMENLDGTRGMGYVSTFFVLLTLYMNLLVHKRKRQYTKNQTKDYSF